MTVRCMRVRMPTGTPVTFAAPPSARHRSCVGVTTKKTKRPTDATEFVARIDTDETAGIVVRTLTTLQTHQQEQAT